jgi:hypothetical protein
MKKEMLVPFFGLITTLTATLSGYDPRPAVINCPVADLIGEPFKYDVIKRYDTIPLYAVGVGACCPRVHQALYNEEIEIVGETECEYCVEIKNAYFVSEEHKNPQTRYWTLKTNCTILNDEIKNYIPIPISYKKTKKKQQRPTIVLTQPWNDNANTGNRFSVGTRFIYCPRYSDDEIITIELYDFVKQKSTTAGIHRSACRIEAPPHNNARAEMLALIRNWIGTACNLIPTKYSAVPYVWGGCSYVDRYAGKFTQKYDKRTKCEIYVYPKMKQAVKTGFDCSCLVLRAAQCVGIPYFCKNSYTAFTQLKPINTYQEIEVGDLLCFPGHIMLIASLEHNTLIEARGYPHYYGKLQEIPIAEHFEGIKTIKQLVEQLRAKKPLKRLDKKGTVVATIRDYKILKLY